MSKFSNFLATLITILVFTLWLYPNIMPEVWKAQAGGVLYIAVFIITVLWGIILASKYFDIE